MTAIFKKDWQVLNRVPANLLFDALGKCECLVRVAGVGDVGNVSIEFIVDIRCSIVFVDNFTIEVAFVCVDEVSGYTIDCVGFVNTGCGREHV